MSMCWVSGTSRLLLHRTEQKGLSPPSSGSKTWDTTLEWNWSNFLRNSHVGWSDDFYLIKGVGQPHWKSHQGASQPDTDDYNPEDKCIIRKCLPPLYDGFKSRRYIRRYFVLFLPGASFALLGFEGMNDGLVAIEAYCEEGPHRNVYLKKPFNPSPCYCTNRH